MKSIKRIHNVSAHQNAIKRSEERARKLAADAPKIRIIDARR